MSYVKDGAEIYRQSFATIRAEADLSRFHPVLERLAVRVIHACGMVDLPSRSSVFRRLRRRRPCGAGARRADSVRRRHGRHRHHARTPARDNDVICTLSDQDVPALAAKLGTRARRLRSSCGGTGWPAPSS